MNNNGLTLNQLAERNAALVTEVEKLRAERDQLAAENTYLLNGAARELNTSWMFHKTMLGAQAALVCLAHGYQAAAREWLEGTTDEAGAVIPDDISVGELPEWFDSQMVSNDGKSGFLTQAEAEEAIKKACPATDAFLAGIKADGVEMFALMFAEEAIKDNNITTGWKARASRAASEYAELLREGAGK
ncbi:TPA: hypothetical protein L8R65_002927 [Klebsiella pneumoniae]|nr:hypothetical protein [Klebsiella pneumoniae]MBG2007805.1 hypothetical protein [Klebsiella pneumoniae]MBG2435061.1 hypothetical protein [Klebsiella pneumoniae]HBQ7796426.1 hypothetical protein [Klebsiella pneumoniae]